MNKQIKTIQMYFTTTQDYENLDWLNESVNNYLELHFITGVKSINKDSKLYGYNVIFTIT